MEKFDTKKAVEILLEKRFGIKDPAKIKNIVEINAYKPLEKGDILVSIGIELIFEESDSNIIKEEYQINNQGIIYSWGNTPVIDNRSLEKPLYE